MSVEITGLETDLLPNGSVSVTTHFRDGSWVTMKSHNGAVTERIDYYELDQVDPMCFRVETMF